MSRTSPRPPLGKYPQFRLYGHVGALPNTIRINSINKIVPNMIMTSFERDEWKPIERPFSLRRMSPDD
jgi:hypothetical protein